MKILALETDIERLKQEVLSPTEQLLLEIHFSGYLFAARLVSCAFLTTVLAAVVIVLLLAGLPAAIVIPVIVLVWLIFVGTKLLRGWIDWRYDVLLITTDKIIHVDQSSILRCSIQQMNLENVATVAAHTQYGDLLPFGKLCFDLKEGTGQKLVLPFVPRARAVASTVANLVMDFQSRRAIKGPNALVYEQAYESNTR